MRRAWTVCAAVVAVTALVGGGCGAGDAAPSGAAPGQTSEPTLPTASREESMPLGRHDAPPAGVARQISFAAIGDDICGGALETPGITFGHLPILIFESPEQLPPADEIEVGMDLYVCVHQVDPDLPIELELNGPEGYHREVTIPVPDYESTTRSWAMPIERTTPRGEYAVEARAGGSQLTSTFDVVNARMPAVRLVGLGLGFEAGETVQAIVVGFEPGETVLVDVYRYDDAVLTYATTLSTRIEDDAVGALTIPTSSRDPRTGYVLRPRMDRPPNQNHDAYLSLE